VRDGASFRRGDNITREVRSKDDSFARVFQGLENGRERSSKTVNGHVRNERIESAASPFKYERHTRRIRTLFAESSTRENICLFINIYLVPFKVMPLGRNTPVPALIPILEALPPCAFRFELCRRRDLHLPDGGKTPSFHDAKFAKVAFFWFLNKPRSARYGRYDPRIKKTDHRRSGGLLVKKNP